MAEKYIFGTPPSIDTWSDTVHGWYLCISDSGEYARHCEIRECRILYHSLSHASQLNNLVISDYRIKIANCELEIDTMRLGIREATLSKIALMRAQARLRGMTCVVTPAMVVGMFDGKERDQVTHARFLARHVGDLKHTLSTLETLESGIVENMLDASNAIEKANLSMHMTKLGEITKTMPKLNTKSRLDSIRKNYAKIQGDLGRAHGLAEDTAEVHQELMDDILDEVPETRDLFFEQMFEEASREIDPQKCTDSFGLLSPRPLHAT